LELRVVILRLAGMLECKSRVFQGIVEKLFFAILEAVFTAVEEGAI
jgi:hypothetical protein